MDTLDIRILRSLYEDPSHSPLGYGVRESAAAVARRLGVDEDTVRHRLKRIHDSGFVSGWHLFVNPHVWGGGEVMVIVDVDPARPRADLVDRLQLVSDVVFVCVCYESLVVCVDYDSETTVARTVELIRRLTGGSIAWVGRTAFPDCQPHLRPRDWDLLRALRRNPLVPCRVLAAEVGISTRSAKGGLARISSQGVAFPWPSMNFRAVMGGLFVHMDVQYRRENERETDASVARQLEPYLWHVLHTLPLRDEALGHCGYDLFSPDVATARQLLETVQGIAGVEAARLYLYEEIVNFFESYDVRLDQHLAEMPTARRPAYMGRHHDSSAEPKRS